MVIKNRILDYRARMGLSQEQLAAKIGISNHTVCFIELSREIPRLELAFRIARYFGVKIEDIFIYEEEKKA